jgi:outer membrane biosynthesis protein TonB
MSTITATFHNEEKNKKKSLRISVALHILILLIALYPILKDDPTQNIDKQYAVAITFDTRGQSNSFKGQAEEGRQRPLNETVDKVRTAPMDKIPNNNTSKSIPQPQVQVPTPQTPTAPAESDIFEEESEVQAVEEVPEVVNEVPKQKVETNTKPQTKNTQVNTD